MQKYVPLVDTRDDRDGFAVMVPDEDGEYYRAADVDSLISELQQRLIACENSLLFEGSIRDYVMRYPAQYET